MEEGAWHSVSWRQRGMGGGGRESTEAPFVSPGPLGAPAVHSLLTLSPGCVKVLTNQCPGSSLRNWLLSSQSWAKAPKHSHLPRHKFLLNSSFRLFNQRRGGGASSSNQAVFVHEQGALIGWEAQRHLQGDNRDLWNCPQPVGSRWVPGFSQKSGLVNPLTSVCHCGSKSYIQWPSVQWGRWC